MVLIWIIHILIIGNNILIIQVIWCMGNINLNSKIFTQIKTLQVYYIVPFSTVVTLYRVSLFQSDVVVFAPTATIDIIDNDSKFHDKMVPYKPHS